MGIWEVQTEPGVTPVALLVVEGQRGIVQELGEVVAAYKALADLELEAASASLALVGLELAVLQSESRQGAQVVHN
jgi:hypothetical protein